uniref:Cupin-like domain-containing protein n=1 Tax=viral metagenome TaxID=1070528 RepID=A0A6C0HHB9_9ZZZZ
MNIIFIVLIFCSVLFLYLHIYFHLKKSNDLEVYEIVQPSKDKLEEICDLRQPVLFEYYNEGLLDACSRENILDVYGAFDIKIRNVKQLPDDETELYIPLPFTSALAAVTDDTEAKYLVENNGDFLEETGLVKTFKYNDGFLRPYMVSNCSYDFIMGSPGLRTPFRYELNYRTFIMVTQGEIRLKLAPPKSAKYLYETKDYENLEFRSPIDPWDVQKQYKADFSKVKCLEITVKKGKIVYLPAFWWYSIAFESSTSVCSFKYRTYMNTIALVPQLSMRLLQTQNVKRTIVKNADLNIKTVNNIDSVENKPEQF